MIFDKGSFRRYIAMMVVLLFTISPLGVLIASVTADTSTVHETDTDFAQGDVGTRIEITGTGDSSLLQLTKKENWVVVSDKDRPRGVYGAAMAYDTDNQVVVMFGGRDSTWNYHNETWIYNATNGTWYNPNPTTYPPKRYWSAMAYDIENKHLVLFGGYSWGADTCGGRCSDTWVYNVSSNTWTKKFPATSPSGRYGHAMTYDGANGNVTIFGGNAAPLTNQIWRYDFVANTWVNPAPASPPNVRYNTGLVYNPVNKTLIMHAGGPFGPQYGDTWEYNSTTNTWTDLSPSSDPGSRYGHSMTWDDRLGKVLMHGGYLTGTGYLNDTWSYDRKTNAWTQIFPEKSPGYGYMATMVFDYKEDVDILFGGWYSGVGYSDRTWLYGDLYRGTGNFTSGTVDSDPAGTTVNWINISWQGEMNGGTSWVLVSANDDNSSWYYVGPDGTILTTYTDATGEPIWNGLDGKRYLKYKIFLMASNPLISPQIDNVTVVYNRAPTPPVLDAPSHFEYVTSDRPTFHLASLELDTEDMLTYSIELSDDNFNTVLKTYDQSQNQTGWTETEYGSEETAVFTVPYAQELENGRTYQWRARAFDGRDWSEMSVVWWFTVDTTPPEKPWSVNDGLEGDLDYTGDTDRLSAHWDSAGDPESGVKTYWYTIGTTPGGSEVLNWTDNGIRLAVTVTGLDLAHAIRYYFSVKAENGAGVFSGITTSDGQTVDTTVPTTPVVKDEGGYTSSSTELSAEWFSQDMESGIVQNMYAIGLMEGATDIVNWTSIGGANAITHSEMDLEEGETYYLSVKTRNSVGNWSAVGSSDGITVDTTPPYNLSITIDDGAEHTNATDVTLGLGANDDISGISEIRLSNDGTVWTPWLPFTAEKGWTLSLSDGLKAVFLEVRDGAGNVEGGASDSIVLDTQPPASLAMELNGGSVLVNTSNVPLTISSYDATSGLAEMSFSEDGVEWGDWSPFSATTTYMFSSGDGDKELLLRVKDAAGNMAGPVNDTILLDTEAPTGVSITLNNNAANTMDTRVTLGIKAEDTVSGVSMLALSNNGHDWTAWEPYINAREWDLDTAVGVKTVYLKVRDGAGNVAGPVNDSIGFGLVTVNLKITKPDRGAEVSGLAKISGVAASESPVTLVQVRIDGGAWKNASGTANWKFEWDTKDYADGIHSIEVRAENELGFSYAGPMEIKVANRTDTTTEGIEGSMGLLLLIVAILVFALAIGFVVGKRPSKGQAGGRVHHEEDYPDEDDTDEEYPERNTTDEAEEGREEE